MKFTKKILSFLLAMVLAVSGIFFVNLKAEAFDRSTRCEFWFSDSPMGPNVPQAITGRDYYFCYKMFDLNTGDSFNSYSDSMNYHVRLTIYNPDNYPIVSYTYDGRDADCVGAYFDRSELWYWAEIEIYGDINAYAWTSIYCQPIDLKADYWTSDAIMGGHKQYFDRNEGCFLNYRLFDSNSGYGLDTLLPSLNYTVEESIVSSSNEVLHRYTYDNDNNFIGARLPSRGTYFGNIKIRGDISADFSTEAYAKYYTKDETYGFVNSDEEFIPRISINGRRIKGSYYMTDEHFSVLEQSIREACWLKNKENNYIAAMTKARYSEWGGSCYGMSVTTVLDKLNMVAVNENFSNSDTINGIRKIRTDNKNIRSLINYYQISQGLTFANPLKYFNEDSLSSGLKEIVKSVRNNNLTLFGFAWNEKSGGETFTYGHALVLQTLIEQNDGSFRLLAYDPNFPGGTTIVEIDKNYKTCKFFSVEENCYIYTLNPIQVEYANNFSKLNKIDIDGKNNVLTQSESTEDLPTQISFDLIGKVTVVNEEGESLVWENNTYSGDMTVLSESYSFGSKNVDGSSVIRVNLAVEDSASYTFITDSKNMNISVIGENIFASVDSSNAEAIVVAQNEGVHILGSDTESEVFMTTGNNADVIEIGSLAADDDVALLFAPMGISVFGATDDCEIRTYFGDSEAKSYEVTPTYGSFLIACDSDKNTIGVWGSADDINYDIDMDYTETLSVESAEITEESAELICGESKELNCSVYPSEATEGVCWMSLDTNVATVDENGKVTAVGVGETSVIVCSPEGDIWDECKIISSAPALTGIVADQERITLSVDETEKINVSPVPEKAELENLTWSSSNTDVVTVDSDGNITAKSAGTATIYIKTADGKHSTQAEVTVLPVEVSGMMIAEADVSVRCGENIQINAEVLPLNATNRAITWRSSNEKVAKVDENGNVVALSCGEALITAESVEGKYTATCKVTVVNSYFDGTFAIETPSTLKINYGDTLILHVDLSANSGLKDYTVEWTVEGTGVEINPSEDGLTCGVTSVQRGKVIVTARVVDKNGEVVRDANGKEISSSQEITSNASFWQKIVSFFKNLFGLNRTIVQTIFKGII